MKNSHSNFHIFANILKMGRGRELHILIEIVFNYDLSAGVNFEKIGVGALNPSYPASPFAKILQ